MSLLTPKSRSKNREILGLDPSRLLQEVNFPLGEGGFLKCLHPGRSTARCETGASRLPRIPGIPVARVRLRDESKCGGRRAVRDREPSKSRSEPKARHSPHTLCRKCALRQRIGSKSVRLQDLNLEMMNLAAN